MIEMPETGRIEQKWHNLSGYIEDDEEGDLVEGN